MPNVVIWARILHSVKKGHYQSEDELSSDVMDYLEKHSSKKYEKFGGWLNEKIRDFLNQTAPSVKRYFSKQTVVLQNGQEVAVTLNLAMPDDSGALVQPQPKGDNWMKITVPIGKHQEERLFDTLAWWNGYSAFVAEWRKQKGQPPIDEDGVVGIRYEAVWDEVREVSLNAISGILSEMQKAENDEEAKMLGLEQETEQKAER